MGQRHAFVLAAMRRVRIPAVGVEDPDASHRAEVSVVSVMRRSATVRGAVAAICMVNFVDAVDKAKIRLQVFPFSLLADVAWGPRKEAVVFRILFVVSAV